MAETAGRRRGIDSAYRGDPARYHRTRAFPPRVAQRIVAALLTWTGPLTRAVDVGAGTGRVAWPLAEAGVPTLALDLSAGMTRFLQARLREHPGLPLTVFQADARRLPLRRHAVDLIVTVHMLHLLPDPEVALQEMRRVLRPEGWLAIGLQEHAADAPVGWAQRLWSAALRREGHPLPMTGWRLYRELWRTLDALGARRVACLTAARWQVQVRPAEVWAGVRERRYSPYWGLSPVQHAVLSRRLSRIFRRRFGPGWRPRAERRAFVWYVYQFREKAPSGAG